MLPFVLCIYYDGAYVVTVVFMIRILLQSASHTPKSIYLSLSQNSLSPDNLLFVLVLLALVYKHMC